MEYVIIDEYGNLLLDADKEILSLNKGDIVWISEFQAYKVTNKHIDYGCMVVTVYVKED
jgi:hypothetical protein